MILLALGRHIELVPDAQRAVLDHPLHEPLHAQLALALYRSGRQAEALRAVADARRLLVEQVGVDPGVALRQLEQQLLNHDAALEWASPSTSTDAPGGSSVPRSPARRRSPAITRPDGAWTTSWRKRRTFRPSSSRRRPVPARPRRSRDG